MTRATAIAAIAANDGTAHVSGGVRSAVLAFNHCRFGKPTDTARPRRCRNRGPSAGGAQRPGRSCCGRCDRASCSCHWRGRHRLGRSSKKSSSSSIISTMTAVAVLGNSASSRSASRFSLSPSSSACAAASLEIQNLRCLVLAVSSICPCSRGGVSARRRTIETVRANTCPRAAARTANRRSSKKNQKLNACDETSARSSRTIICPARVCGKNRFTTL